MDQISLFDDEKIKNEESNNAAGENGGGRITEVNVEEQMKDCYIDYAVSVIKGRALPDVRDGLKPVHRRILYAMQQTGMTPDKPTRKSARIVGEVLGKYHPHGDSSVYDAMVRMAQDFSMRYPMIQGQGNFGSIDGDGAAAMRYTEAKMSKIAMELVRDITKDTVDFVPNFDESEMEPSVLPASFPNLLVNGSEGIAVGMSTKIPPHNIREAIDAALLVLKKPKASVDDILKVMPGPDFPTGAIINGSDGIREAYETGRGKIKVRGKVRIEKGKRGKNNIIISEIPYGVNKANLVEKIAKIAKERAVGKGIADVRDETDLKNGLSVIVEVKKGFDPHVIEDALYKYTDLQTTYGYNFLCLVDEVVPKTLSINEYLNRYLDFKRETVRRRTVYDLKKIKDRIEILEALVIVLDNIDRTIEIIRSSKTVPEARQRLMAEFNINVRQAQAVLDMRLQKLTNLESEKIRKELASCRKEAERLQCILDSTRKMNNLIRKELLEIKKNYGDERRTQIITEEAKIMDISKALEKNVTAVVTHRGYINIAEPGKKKDEPKDVIIQTFETSTGGSLYVFTDDGTVYKKRIDATGIVDEKGYSHINSLFDNCSGGIISTMINVRSGIIIVTKNAMIKRMNAKELLEQQRQSASYINLKNDDSVIAVLPYQKGRDLTVVSTDGYGLTFSCDELREMKRTAAGVKAMKTDGKVVSAYYSGKTVVLTENGIMKEIAETRMKPQARAGKGIKLVDVNERTGKVVGAGTGRFVVISKDKEIDISEEKLSQTHKGYKGKPLSERGSEIIFLSTDLIRKK